MALHLAMCVLTIPPSSNTYKRLEQIQYFQPKSFQFITAYILQIDHPAQLVVPDGLSADGLLTISKENS